MKLHTLIIVFLSVFPELFSQDYLSHLHAFNSDPFYTTYASSVENSIYNIDQGYQLIWSDPERGVELYSEQSGTFGILFSSGNILKSSLAEFSKPPVLTMTYSDLFKLFYYPYPEIKVEYTGIAVNSGNMLLEVTISNESSFDKQITAYPYILFNDQLFSAAEKVSGGISFNYLRHADSWMKEHNIPYAEKISNIFIADADISGYGTYAGFYKQKDTTGDYLINSLKKGALLNGLINENKAAVFSLNFSLTPGQVRKFRIIRSIFLNENKPSLEKIKNILHTNIADEISRNESLFNNVPPLQFADKIQEAVYWNAFNLMHQCMMGPEGKCSYNYYVFSREPKWGWGYGGQVFHESLTMLAYVYLDPTGAMNSQRVYFERQHQDGYINYRTGPYLDEQIETDGQLTSSAPWFNWQNSEIYKVTKDRAFLKEAYESGKKFYEYYTSNRDSDKDGLCEWGADAVLESVRDARVAVWDEVGDPKNFEAVDCNIMLVSEANSLSYMAKELGLGKESDSFRLDAENRKSLINKYMWDEETGFYYNVNKTDHSFTFKQKDDLKRKEIIGFLALWAKVADKNQAEKLISHLNNPEEFYRNYGIPTLSADDPYYNPIGYWNGPVWLPWQYLVFRGLLNYAYISEAKKLTARITDNVSYQLSANHYFWEFYSADDLQAGWNKAYIWSGIIARFFIDLYAVK